MSRLDPKLVELLVCPVCKGPLEWDAKNCQLNCQSDQLSYPVRDGIPVLIENEAVPLKENK